MNTPATPASRIMIIGAGPSGLMAAERLAKAGYGVDVFEKMPSVARKFLMAGRGGLNLTHSEPRPAFDARYGKRAEPIGVWLDGFDARALMAWADALGQETFTGSSGRIFPKAMKASPMVRAWLVRLESLGVKIHTRHEWTGSRDGQWLFMTPEGEKRLDAPAVILALGGGSYAKLGSDGAWMGWARQQGIETRPLRAANVGFSVDWSDILRAKFAGQPVKNLALRHKDKMHRGEVMLTTYGIEGGGIYALSAALRDSILAEGKAVLDIDLRPDLCLEDIVQRLSKSKGKNSLTNHLRKTLHLDPASIALMREAGALPDDAHALAARVKGVSIILYDVQGIERAISSSGGICFDQFDEGLMLKSRAGVFVCGEMLDWEAPTGGYLLQACFASGVRAAEGVDKFLREKGSTA